MTAASGPTRAGRSAGDASAEVIVVGGGPAGLSAALVLGRACRQVLLVDDRRPRNAAARAIHGFLTRDGMAPADLRRIGRAQLRRFANVRLVEGTVTAAAPLPTGRGFVVTTAAGWSARCRALIVATGVIDDVPTIPGFASLYGRSVFHCPFCDGWAYRDRPVAVYGRGARGAGLALELLGWSSDVALCTDGDAALPADDAARLRRNGIAVHTDRVRRLDEGRGGRLRAVVFEDAAPLLRDALFFSTGQRPASPLATALGCQITEKGAVRTAAHESTDVPGLFVVGDASRNLQWVALAAAEGAEAAFAVTQLLVREGWR